MKAKNIVLSVLILSILSASVVLAVDSITYDFDDVNVLYAATFTAKPIEGVDSSNTWISDLVGEDKKLTITYGVVELKKDGEVLVTEEFVKVGGSEGSKRFLVNSAAYNYWEGTNKYSQILSFFWSAKKLEGTSIVKDFTKPIYSTCFSRKYDEDGNRYSFFLSFSNDGETASQECTGGTATLMYEADTGSIEESGDATARSV
jgi:hypothetical protein